MNYKDRIIANPKVMLGKPVIKGTRITVELILTKLSDDDTVEGILKSYPHITRADIMACIAYAADVISNEAMLDVE
ncbi:MAG: DUF433 domain-containing protein [Bacteroidia bacterium]